MKKGKIILGAVALVVTAGSTLAFKVANKFNSRKQIFVQIGTPGLSGAACLQCSAWTNNSAGTSGSSCVTVVGKHKVFARNNQTLFTKVKVGAIHTCTHPTISWTSVF